MNYIRREIKETEYTLIEDFLYEAIFIPRGKEIPSRTIIYQQQLQVYVDGFGNKDDKSGCGSCWKGCGSGLCSSNE